MTTIEHTQQADYVGDSATFAVCSCGEIAVYGPDCEYVTSSEAFEGHVAQVGVRAEALSAVSPVAERPSLAEIEERAQAATAGPWTAGDGDYDDDYDVPVYTPSGGAICMSPDDGVRGGHERADAEFIAHARADVPALLSAVRAVADLHQPVRGHCSPDVPCCRCCPDDLGAESVPHPCATYAALTRHLTIPEETNHG